MEEKSHHYFTSEALVKFKSAEGKIVKKVICHLWQNAANPHETVELIDNLELNFGDGSKITIACNENGEGLDVIDFNYKESAAALENEFENKIKIFAVNASGTAMWKDIIDKELKAVQISKDGDFYISDSILLNFGTEKRIVSVSPMDGLLIDYYEE